jgi:hypothetical protein
MLRMRTALTVLLPPALAAALLAAPGAARAQSPHGDTWRDVWYVGLGLGSGGGSYVLDGQRVNFRHTHGPGADPLQLSFQLEAGATVTRTLLLGGELSVTTSSVSVSLGDSTLVLSQLLAVATLFPTERGVFLRAGAGFAGLSQEWDDGFGYARSSAGGVAVLGGLGYAWWLGRSFNLTLHADVSAQRYGSGGGDPSSSAALAAYLGFRWY